MPMAIRVDMFSLRMVLVAVLSVSLLGGCAVGRDFVRPPSAALKLRQTTLDQVTAMMGPPILEGSDVLNGKTVKTVTYAASGGTPAQGDGAGARAMAFYFFNGALVGYEFVSNRTEDSTDFNDRKLNNIQKGVTTRDQVHQFLGQPCGYRVYPLIDNGDDEAEVYAFASASGIGFGRKVSRKSLQVTFNPAGVVEDVKFNSSAIR
jgi:outer membrane protein assembly factor BamE (lipoprotein component of BamABCDE complex)